MKNVFIKQIEYFFFASLSKLNYATTNKRKTMKSHLMTDWKMYEKICNASNEISPRIICES